MKFKHYLNLKENYNKDVLNNLIKRITQWKEDRTQGKKDTFNYKPEEITEIENIINLGKQKCLDIFNKNFPDEWKKYTNWEKNLKDKNLLFGHRASLSGLGPRFKIGEFDFNDPEYVTVTEPFYNLLMWREIIKNLKKSIEENNRHHQFEINNTLTALLRLPTLLKQNNI